jgi:hypothetical protein
MIDNSKEHTYIEHKDTKVVKYFDKYDFCGSESTLKDIKYNDSPYSFTKEELITASIVADKFNDSYVKTSGKFDIVEGEFVKTAFSNKDIVIGILTKYPDLIADEDREKATIILEYLEDRFAFKILSDTLTEFESSITYFMSNDSTVSTNMVGVASYVPTYYSSNTKNELLNDRSTNAGHLGKIGEKVDTEIEIIGRKYLAETQYGGSGYMVNAITSDNHRVTFFTTNEDIANSKKNIKVSCKIKALGKAWNDKNVNETKVNYVKFS